MGNEELRAAVSRAGLETVLDEEDLGRLVPASTVRRFHRGELLWRAGDAPKGLFLLMEGEVRIVRARDGRQHLVHVGRPGATMGEVPLFAGRGYPATAIAARDGAAVVILPDAVRALAARNARFSALLLRNVSRRLSGLVDRLEANTLGGVRGRLAASLLGLAAGRTPGETLAFPGTQAEWAEDLGTVREALSRELRSLVDAGLLERRGRGTFAIVDEAGLERIALPE